MTSRKHLIWMVSLLFHPVIISFSLTFCLSVCLSVCLSICLFFFPLSGSLSHSLLLSLFFSLTLSPSLSLFSLSLFLSFFLYLFPHCVCIYLIFISIPTFNPLPQSKFQNILSYNSFCLIRSWYWRPPLDDFRLLSRNWWRLNIRLWLACRRYLFKDIYDVLNFFFDFLKILLRHHFLLLFFIFLSFYALGNHNKIYLYRTDHLIYCINLSY